MTYGNLERLLRKIDPVCQDFERRLVAGDRPGLDDWIPGDWSREEQDFLRRHLLELVADHERESSASTAGGDDGSGETTSQSRRPPLEGDVEPDWGRDDRYELLEEIGRGGMGVVYRARDRQLGREVAIKTLLVGSATDVAARVRFRTEAEAAATLDHPAIVPVLEVGELAGQPFIAMPFLTGGHLGARKAELASDRREVARLVAVIARAVHTAHERGILHRDLKLANILLDADGEPHVADFGLARRIDAGEGLTLTGQVVGTPHAMSPEQARGETVQVASDVYGLGVILYELLTGEPPFTGDSLLTLARRIESEPARSPRESNPDVATDLATITMKCLEKAPRSRYDGALHLARDLEAWLDGRPIAARPVSRLERVALWARREPLLAGSLAVALVLLLGFAVGGPLVARRQGQLREQADREAGRATRRGRELRRTLYASEMVLAAGSSLGLGDQASLQELLSHWDPRPGEEDLRGFEWYLHRGKLDHAEHVEILAGTGLWTAEIQAWSPDGRRLTVLEDGGLTSFERADGAWGRVHRHELEGATALAIAADHAGRLLAVTTSADEVLLLDARTFETVRRMTGVERGNRIEWFPDDRALLVSAGEVRATKSLTVFDPETGKVVERRNRETSGYDWTSIDPLDPRRVLHMGDPEARALLWNRDDGREAPLEFPVEPGFLREARFSPDGAMIAVATEYDGVQLFDGRTGAWMAGMREAGRSDVRALAWSPDSSMLASAGFGRVITVWDAARRLPRGRLRGHVRGIDHLAWSPDGAMIASIDQIARLRLWRAGDFEAVPTFAMRLRRDAFQPIAGHPESDLVAVSARGRRLVVVDVAERRVVFDEVAPCDGVGAICWHPDGRTLALLSAGDGIAVLRDGAYREVRRGKPGRPRTMDGVWGPDGRSFLRVGYPGRIEQVALEVGEVVRELGPRAWYTAILYDPFAGLVHAARIGASEGPDDRPRHAIHTYSADTLEEVGVIDLGREIVNHMVPLGDGRFAAASTTGPVFVFDGRTGETVRRLSGASDVGAAVALSPDRSRLAGVSHDGRLRIWNTVTWQLVLDVVGHDGREIHGVAWPGGGDALATTGLDDALRIWDSARGRRLGPVGETADDVMETAPGR